MASHQVAQSRRIVYELYKPELMTKLMDFNGRFGMGTIYLSIYLLAASKEEMTHDIRIRE